MLLPIINKIIVKYSSIIIIEISFVFYVVAYVQRIKDIIVFDNEILNLSIRQIALFGTSQLPFIIEAIFAHKKIYSKLYNIANNIKYKNILSVILITLMIIAHRIKLYLLQYLQV